MLVSKLMTKRVIRIDEDSTVQEAAEKMGNEHIGSLLVIRRGEDVGIITERDIMSKIIARKGDLKRTRVKEIMSEPLITVDRNVTGENAIKAMVDNKVRRLLIMDGDQVVGIFTTSDVTKLTR